jgi:hypothetical protein
MIAAKVIGTGELNRVPESERSQNRARRSQALFDQNAATVLAFLH